MTCVVLVCKALLARIFVSEGSSQMFAVVVRRVRHRLGIDPDQHLLRVSGVTM